MAVESKRQPVIHWKQTEFGHDLGGSNELTNAGLRVLIIEDNEFEARIMERIIKKSVPQAKVEFAVTYYEAILLLYAERFDYIFCDFFFDRKKSSLSIWQNFIKMHCKGKFYIVSSMGVGQYLDVVRGLRVCPAFLPKPMRGDFFQKIIESDRRVSSYG